MSIDKFKFKTKIYDNNEYVLVQDLKLLDLHYCNEMNIANNMMHDMNFKIERLKIRYENLLEVHECTKLNNMNLKEEIMSLSLEFDEFRNK